MFKLRTTVASSLLLGIAAACLTTSAAAATTHQVVDYSEFFAIKPMALMHMMDEGGKGFVTKEEFMKFQEEFFNKMDKDRDGKITPQEWLGRELRKSDG